MFIFITFSFGFMIKECKCKVFIFFKKGCFVPNTVSGLFVKKMYQWQITSLDIFDRFNVLY